MLVSLTVMLDFTGFGLILPSLPFWAQRFGARPFGVGLLVTTFAAGQFIFTPALGILSDRFGRRPVILASLAVEAAGYALSALAGSLPVLLGARFIAGLGASNIGSAQAVVADVAAPGDRAKSMGMVGAAMGLGFILGPALGGILSVFGLAAPLWGGLAATMLNLVLTSRLLPETRPRPTISAPAPSVNPFRNLVMGGLARFVAINLIVTVAFAAMEAIYPLLSQRLLGWGALENGGMFAFVGMVVVLAQGWGVGHLVRRLGERRLLLAGLLQMGVGLAMLPFSTSLPLMLLSLGVLSAGLAVTLPVLSTMVSFSAARQGQGEALGLNQGAGALGRIVGPLGAGALFGTSGPVLTFFVAAALVALALAMALPQAAMPLGLAEPLVQHEVHVP